MVQVSPFTERSSAPCLSLAWHLQTPPQQQCQGAWLELHEEGILGPSCRHLWHRCGRRHSSSAMTGQYRGYCLKIFFPARLPLPWSICQKSSGFCGTFCLSAFNAISKLLPSSFPTLGTQAERKPREPSTVFLEFCLLATLQSLFSSHPLLPW